jgi:hypothetical protein
MDRYDDMALNIIADIQGKPFVLAQQLLTSRLRVLEASLRAQFWLDLDKLVPRHGLSRTEHEKQREQQKDHDEERQDGWAV